MEKENNIQDSKTNYDYSDSELEFLKEARSLAVQFQEEYAKNKKGLPRSKQKELTEKNKK